MAKATSDLNSETISTMTSAEIYAKNREAHKGTFMDKTWRRASAESIEALEDPTLSRR